ncbi:MAG: hypothetical protein KBT34_10320 [Prevotella sp.]|nr:hypothetical protein [Candidatus Prevotella equi]
MTTDNYILIGIGIAVGVLFGINQKLSDISMYLYYLCQFVHNKYEKE